MEELRAEKSESEAKGGSPEQLAKLRWYRRRRVRLVLRLLIYGLVGWVLLGWLERRMAFHPTGPWDAQLLDSELEVKFQTEDGVELSGAWFPRAEARGVVLYCHGNAGNISHRFEVARSYNELGYSVFLFDYRGYGRSAGRPTEAGLLLDARAAYLEAERLGQQLPILKGRSLGTVPAILLAAERPARGLVLDSPLESARAMARIVLPVPGIQYLVRLQLNNVENIEDISCPVLVLHGEMDQVIPFDQGRAVFQAAPEPKHFLPLPGLGHNEPRERAAIRAALRQFLDGLSG